ncbi:MAG: O-antigen ligase family protein [Actinomycetota bacterium]
MAGFATAAAGANLLLGLGAAIGQRALLLALVVGLLPALLIAFGALVEAHRALLAWAAFAITFTGLPFSDPLPLPGGSIYATDVLLLLAFGAWLASRLSQELQPERVRLSVVFRWPLALLAITVLFGVLEGHERYDTSIIGQPFRLVLYSAIALALTDTTPASAWQAITRVFYAGAVIQSFYAVYYLASGTSQTDSATLSTGGVRALALSTAVYLTGSMICALLNLELERRPVRQLGHAAVGGLALFGVIVAFGRTTYAAVALIVPILLVTRRYMRRTVMAMLPLFAPLLVLAVLLVSNVAPDLLPTLRDRVTGTSSDDLNVRYREEAREAVLEGVGEDWVTGVGFGRSNRFALQGVIYTISDDPHNSYVWLLAGGGVLALGSFLLLCLLYVVDALRRLRGADAVQQALIVWALGTWFAFMVNAAGGVVLPHTIMLLTIWILFALPSLVARPRHELSP